MVFDVTCAMCAAHAVLTVCTCEPRVTCPDCGNGNSVPVEGDDFGAVEENE